MGDTTFIDKVTHVMASWLNPVNNAIYKAIGSGGTAPTTAAEVRDNIGLTSAGAPSGSDLVGLFPEGGSTRNTVQSAFDEMRSTAGGSFVGNNPAGHIAAVTVQAAINELDTEKAKLAGGNSFSGVAGVGSQIVEYTTPVASGAGDGIGFGALVHNQDGGNTDNLVALVGHAYHDGAFNSPNAAFGLATEAWSNPTNFCTLIGGEVSVISQSPTMANPSVGLNSVFKNRSDIATHPTAPVVSGSLYNYNSTAVFISSQTRPSGAGAAWGSVGSGWNVVMRVGDPGSPGLDWEGGQYYAGSSTYKAYSTIVDMTNCLQDLAGGFPWFALYRNASTYWGMRFNGILTGQLDTCNIKPNAGGSGYAIGDSGHIVGGGGAGATYYVTNVSAGAVTEVVITVGGSGYVVTAAASTSVISGAGSGLTIGISIAVGLIYGANVAITAGGTGYAVGNFVYLSGGTAGFARPIFKVTSVSGGVVTGVELQFSDVVVPRIYTIGVGFTAATTYATVALPGVTGTGLTLYVSETHNDLVIGGEKWEFWRMLNPSNPISSGSRHGYIDSSFPGSPLTIDTSGATYTFPNDKPL